MEKNVTRLLFSSDSEKEKVSKDFKKCQVLNLFTKKTKIDKKKI